MRWSTWRLNQPTTSPDAWSIIDRQSKLKRDDKDVHDVLDRRLKWIEKREKERGTDGGKLSYFVARLGDDKNRLGVTT